MKPLEFMVTGKEGKLEFKLYIDGDKEQMLLAIKYLKKHLRLMKLKMREDAKTNKEVRT